MQIFRASGSAEGKRLRQAAAKLKEANGLLAGARKDAEAAKDFLSGWLEKERAWDIGQMKIGEGVIIEGCLVIEIGKQHRLDAKGFLMALPRLHAKFSRDFPVTNFKPIV